MMCADERPRDVLTLGSIPLPVHLCFQAVGEQMVRPRQKHVFLALEDQKKITHVHESVCAR